MEHLPGRTEPVKSERGSLGRAEVFDTEVVAIHRAVRRAARGRPTRTRVFSDNLAAVESCKHRVAPSSQAGVLEVQEILRKRDKIRLRWCPGHQGIAGNGAADTEVGTAATADSGQAAPPTLAWVKSWAKAEKQKVVQEWWDENAPGSYKALGLGPRPDAEGLSRKEMARLMAYRTGHGKFASHFRRLNISAADPECQCGAVLDPRHLVQCPKRRKIVHEAREKYKIETEEETYRFSLGNGFKGIGAREWFPKLFK